METIELKLDEEEAEWLLDYLKHIRNHLMTECEKFNSPVHYLIDKLKDGLEE